MLTSTSITPHAAEPLTETLQQCRQHTCVTIIFTGSYEADTTFSHYNVSDEHKVMLALAQQTLTKLT